MSYLVECLAVLPQRGHLLLKLNKAEVHYMLQIIAMLITFKEFTYDFHKSIKILYHDDKRISYS